MCYMEITYRTHQFRRQTKEILDQVELGNDVRIIRGNNTYRITLAGETHPSIKTILQKLDERIKQLETAVHGKASAGPVVNEPRYEKGQW